MEPTTLISILGPIAGGLAKILGLSIADRFKKHFNPSAIEKAIKAGASAVDKWQEELPIQEHLFYGAKSDGWNSYRKYLDNVFKHHLVLEQLQRPLTDNGEPDIEILLEVFETEAQISNIALVSESLRPWMERFINGYFQNLAGIKFKRAKEDYCRQLVERYSDIKFTGIAVPGQEVDKSDRLAEIFVMPDVEDISTVSLDFEREFWRAADRPRQAELMREQRERSLLANRAGSKFLASQLVGRSRKKAVLLGAPGSGKTTLMSYFAVMLAREQWEALGLAADADWLPILIEIRSWERKSEEMNPLEYARYFAEKDLQTNPLPADFFKHWLAEGRALILLDGLDEVAEVGKRDRIVRRIKSFLHQYDKNWAIVTSRPAGYRRDFFRTEEFPHYELQPFDDEKIERFIDNWYRSRVPGRLEAQRRKESLRKALEESDRIKLLARNPLLLTIIAMIQHYQGRLPKKRHELYDKAVETLLINWDKNREISSDNKLRRLDIEDDVRRLMEALAFWVHTQGSVGESEGGTLIDKEELISQLKKEIKILKAIEPHEAEAEAERLVGWVRDRAGLLNEQGQDCYAFAHKTFQEYLCSREIHYQADNEDDFEIVLGQIRENLHDAHWREVLLLLVAQQKRKKAARAIRGILTAGSEYEEWLHRDLLFAGSCLAENPPNLQAADGALSREILQGLVELEVSDRVGWRVRRSVFKVLCAMRDTDFEGQALELLKERTDVINKWRLLEYRAALGEEEEAIDALVALLKDEDSGVRWSAAYALGNLGNSSQTVLDALVALLKDEDSWVRKSAADALGKLGKSSQTVLDALVALLKDEESRVRKSAADALGNLGNSSQTVLDALVALLKDEESLVRESAADALGKLGNSSQTVLDALVALLKDEESGVRWSAADALGKLGKSSQTVLDALVALLKDEESRVRKSAADALGKLGNSSQTVLDALVALLKDEDSWVRKSAAEALGNLGNSSQTVLDALVALLKDEDSDVRWSAADALGKLGKSSQTVLDALVALLKDEDSDVRKSAADALGKLGNSSQTVLDALVALLKDEDSWVRKSAAYALGNLGNSSQTVLDALVALLKDEDSGVRWSAAYALGNLGKKSPDAVAAIVQWIEQHRDSEYIGDGIDALWDILAEEQS